VEDGTGLVRVILWKKKKECMAQQRLIHKCNGNHYICVIGEVGDDYGVHKMIAFDVRLFDQLVLATKSHNIFRR
jgi:hypothetical protein